MLTALVVVVVLSGASMARADDAPEAGAIRWSVGPADESGPDDRAVVEHTLDPGATVDDFVAVRNVSDQEVVFRLTAADGYYTRSGRFDILTADERSVDSGTWISIADSVTVPAGETVTVPFTVRVPDNVEPGDHAAGITASVLSVRSAAGGAAVGLESRVGVKVLTRVTGDIVPAASVDGVTGSYTTSWNPFRPGEVTVSFDVVDAGNTRLRATGTVSAAGGTAHFPADGEIEQVLLPGDRRSLVVTVEGVWPTLLAPTTITLNAEALSMDGSALASVPVSIQTTVWAVPWPQLVVLLGVALVVGAVVAGRIRSRSRLRILLDEARQEGMRAAREPAKAEADVHLDDRETVSPAAASTTRARRIREDE